MIPWKYFYVSSNLLHILFLLQSETCSQLHVLAFGKRINILRYIPLLSLKDLVCASCNACNAKGNYHSTGARRGSRGIDEILTKCRQNS